jgi:PAS domain-containing protein
MANEPSIATADRPVLARLMQLADAAGIVTCAIAVLVLLGYVLDIEFLRRPIADASVVHPVTAFCLLLTGVAAVGRRVPAVTVAAAGLVAGIATLRLIDAVLGSGILASITPYSSILEQQANVPNPVVLGLNTALGLLAISASQLLAWRALWSASQVLCCIGTMPFAIALMGYLYDLRQLHGVLSPGTAVAGLIAAAAILLVEPDQGILRALLGTGAPGRLARWLLLGSMTITVAVGWILSLYTEPADRPLLATEVIALVAFINAIVTIAIVQFDIGDRQRVEQEAELQRVLLALRIGQQEQARDARIFQTALNHLDQGVLLIDAEDRIVVCNRRAIEILNLAAGMMASRPAHADVLEHLRRIGEFESGEAGKQALQRAAKHPTEPDVYERRRPNGRIIEVRNFPIDGGGVVRTVSDITARRAVEESLRDAAGADRRINLTELGAPRAPAPDQGTRRGSETLPYLEDRGFVA